MEKNLNKMEPNKRENLTSSVKCLDYDCEYDVTSSVAQHHIFLSKMPGNAPRMLCNNFQGYQQLPREKKKLIMRRSEFFFVFSYDFVED